MKKCLPLPRHKSSSCVGVTLLECSITIALFLLLLLCLVPTITFFKRTQIEQELSMLQLTCTLLQQQAQSRQQKQFLTFHPSINTYSYGANKVALPAALSFGYKPHSKGPPAVPRKPITNPITFANNTVIFYETGTMSAGTVYLCDKQHKYCYALTVPIGNKLLVQLYRLQNGGWEKIREMSSHRQIK